MDLGAGRSRPRIPSRPVVAARLPAVAKGEEGAMSEPTEAELEIQAERDGRMHYPVAFLQHLIDTGEGWASESAVGQAIVRALDDGTCVLGPAARRDYHGRVVPARSDVPAGEKGSLAYANRLRGERGDPLLVEAPDGTVTVEGR